jgi:hypothetical protein
MVHASSRTPRHGPPSLAGARYVTGVSGAGGHVESYFLKANAPHSRRALWLKTTIYASARGADAREPRAPHAIAEAWAIAFDGEGGHVAVKASVPLASAHFDAERVDVQVAGASLRADGSRGAIDAGGRTIAWDLTFTSDGLPFVPFRHAWMYEAKFPSTKTVSPFPDLRASGWMTVNGERWDIDRWPGLLGHNWGARHVPLYAWGHCNVWTGDDGQPLDELVFEGLSGSVKAGPMMSPLLSVFCLRWRGVTYSLNGVLDLTRSSADVTPRRWRFEGANRHLSLRGEFWAATDDFVGLHYENPSGPPTHCLNSELAGARLEVEVKGRAPLVATSRAAALEIGTTDPTHGVRMYL